MPISAASRATAAALLLLTTAAAGSALAAGEGDHWAYPPKDAAAARHLRIERQAADLLNEAVRHVQTSVPGCAFRFRPTAPEPTHDAPSQALLDVLAPLRRAAEPGDAATGVPLLGVGGETYVDYTRTVTAADGRRLTIVIGRSTPAPFRPSKRCLDLEHAYLVKLVRHKPRKVRSLALGHFGFMRHGQEQNAKLPTAPQDAIYLFHEGGGGGGAGVADFVQRGVFGSSGGGPGSRAGSQLDGLLPNGVASVTLEYPRVRSRGRWFKPTVYPSAYTATVPVQDNVLSAHVPRPAEDAFPHRMVWRDAAGQVVHTFTDPSM
jgi:hypothetical protein